MPAYRHPKGKYETIAVKLRRKGGTFSMNPYDGFTLSGGYSANNASNRTTLAITNSGAANPLNAPTPSYGTPVLFIEAAVKPRSVAFQVGHSSVTIQSTSLQSGAYYDIVAYAGDRQVASYASAYPANNGELVVQTPFSGLSITPGEPVTIELVALSAESLLVPCSSCNNGAVDYYNANAPGGITASTAVSYANSVAVDDSDNIYVGANSATECQGLIIELYSIGGTFSYTDNLGCESQPRSIAPASGASPAFDAAEAVSYQMLSFPDQGVNSSFGYTDPNLIALATITVDGANNVYLGGTNSSNAPEVDFLTPSQQLSSLGLQLSGTPTALAIDTQGDLLVAECGVGIAVFPPGATTPSSFYDAHNCPSSMVFGNGGNWLYVIDHGIQRGYYNVFVYEYPGGGVTTEWYDGMPYQDFPTQIAIEPRVPLFNPDLYRKERPYWKYWGDLKRNPKPTSKRTVNLN